MIIEQERQRQAEGAPEPAPGPSWAMGELHRELDRTRSLPRRRPDLGAGAYEEGGQVHKPSRGQKVLGYVGTFLGGVGGGMRGAARAHEGYFERPYGEAMQRAAVEEELGRARRKDLLDVVQEERQARAEEELGRQRRATTQLRVRQAEELGRAKPERVHFGPAVEIAGEGGGRVRVQPIYEGSRLLRYESLGAVPDPVVTPYQREMLDLGRSRVDLSRELGRRRLRGAGASPRGRAAPRTVRTKDGTYQWNPRTERYDIPVGAEAAADRSELGEEYATAQKEWSERKYTFSKAEASGDPVRTKAAKDAFEKADEALRVARSRLEAVERRRSGGSRD